MKTDVTCSVAGLVSVLFSAQYMRSVIPQKHVFEKKYGQRHVNESSNTALRTFLRR